MEKVLERVKNNNSDHYCKRFSTSQHLIKMLFGVISGRNSLRELCGGIVSYWHKISHCKLHYYPKRSTLSDSNKRRNTIVFVEIYGDLVKLYLPELSDSHNQLVIDKKTFAIDSTTISLFQPVFECVGRNPSNGKRKGGVKSHHKLDLQIPVKVYHSDAKQHDSLFIYHQDVMNKNEVAIFDKAYNDYSLFNKWNNEGIFFVTRLKDNAKDILLEEYELNDLTPDEVLRDAKIALKYREGKDEKTVKLRLVSYYDPKTNKSFHFLTNLFEEKPEQIANLYKKRWKVELLFKKIKQNFPLQYFYGESKNAIELQIWITLIELLLISVLKKRLTKSWGFSNLVSLLQKHLFSYVKFEDFFNNVEKFAKDFVKNKDKLDPQMKLFEK